MALTAQGVERIWELLAAQLVGTGRLRVGDGSASADAAIDRAEVVEGPALEVEGSFASDEANFEWSRQSVLIEDLELDVAEEDLGRKAGGSDWSLTVRLRLNPA